MDCVLEDCPNWREEPWGEVSTNIRDMPMTSFELSSYCPVISYPDLLSTKPRDLGSR